jgi:hypothetical protein
MTNKLYTLKDWRRDRILKIEIGQYVDYGVIDALMDGLPPLTYSDGIFQVGEPDDQNVRTGELLYKTFVDDGGYRYVGICPEGSTVDETKESYAYQGISSLNLDNNNNNNNNNNIQENKKHMKITEKELHNLINECVQDYIQENQLNEGFLNKLKGWGNVASQDAQDVGTAINNKYKQLKDGFTKRKEKVGNYNTKMNNAKAMDKHAKMVNKIMPTLRELQTTLKTDNTLDAKQRKYLSSAISFLNTFVRTLQQQGQQYRDEANAVFNPQQPQEGQTNIAAESVKRLEKIITESIKRNLK